MQSTFFSDVLLDFKVFVKGRTWRRVSIVVWCLIKEKLLDILWLLSLFTLATFLLTKKPFIVKSQLSESHLSIRIIQWVSHTFLASVRAVTSILLEKHRRFTDLAIRRDSVKLRLIANWCLLTLSLLKGPFCVNFEICKAVLDFRLFDSCSCDVQILKDFLVSEEHIQAVIIVRIQIVEQGQQDLAIS